MHRSRRSRRRGSDRAFASAAIPTCTNAPSCDRRHRERNRAFRREPRATGADHTARIEPGREHARRRRRRRQLAARTVAEPHRRVARERDRRRIEHRRWRIVKLGELEPAAREHHEQQAAVSSAREAPDLDRARAVQVLVRPHDGVRRWHQGAAARAQLHDRGRARGQHDRAREDDPVRAAQGRDARAVRRVEGARAARRAQPALRDRARRRASSNSRCAASAT